MFGKEKEKEQGVNPAAWAQFGPTRWPGRGIAGWLLAGWPRTAWWRLPAAAGLAFLGFGLLGSAQWPGGGEGARWCTAARDSHPGWWTTRSVLVDSVHSLFSLSSARGAPSAARVRRRSSPCSPLSPRLPGSTQRSGGAPVAVFPGLCPLLACRTHARCVLG